MDARISIITLGVDDLERARRFYCDGLGWSASSAGGEEVTFLRTSGAVLALYLRHLLAADANLVAPHSGFGGIALAHNVPERDDVARVLEEAVAAGATLRQPGGGCLLGRSQRLLRRSGRSSLGSGLESLLPRWPPMAACNCRKRTDGLRLNSGQLWMVELQALGDMSLEPVDQLSAREKVPDASASMICSLPDQPTPQSDDR